MSSASKSLRDQAQQAAAQLAEQIVPHLEGVRDQLDEAREQLAPRLSEARDQLAPRFSEAREQLSPLLDQAREQLTPLLEEAHKQLDEAREQAGPLAAEARRLGEHAAAAARGEDTSSSGGGKKKWFALAAVLGGAAIAAKKALDSGSGTHAGYPAATAPAPMPTAATGGVPTQPRDTSVAADATPDDAAGAAPGEALADSTEAPHGVTTPDNPAEVTRITPESDV